MGPVEYAANEECTPPTIAAGADRIDTAQVIDTVTMALGGGTCDSVTGKILNGDPLPAWMTLDKTGVNMGRLILAPNDSVDATDYIFTAHGCSDTTDTVNIIVTWGDVSLASVEPDTVWWDDTATIIGRGFKNNQITGTDTSTFAWGDSTPTIVLWKNDTIDPICPHMDTGFYTFQACNGSMCDTLKTDSIYVAGYRYPQYTLTVANDGNGTNTTPSAGDTTVDSSSTFPLQASPDAGWVFLEWTRSNENVTITDSTASTTTITVNGDATVTATFFERCDSLVWAGANDMNNAANYTIGNDGPAADEIKATDTLFFSSGSTTATASGNLTVAKVVTTAGYSGAWSILGYTLTIDDGYFDGTGAYDFGNGITVNGASGTLHFGSTLGTVTGTSCVLTMNTATAGIIDDDKEIIINQLVVGSNAIVNNTGAETITMQSANPLVFTNGGSLTLTNRINLRCNATGNMITVLAGIPAFVNNSPSAVPFSVTASNVTASIPAINITGTGLAIQFSQIIGSEENVVYNFTGTFSNTTETRFFSNTGVGPVTYNTNNNAMNFTGGLSVGASAAGAYTLNFGSSIVSVLSYYSGAGTNNATINLGSSVWSVSENWDYGPTHTVNPGTSLVAFNGSGDQTIISNNKSFFDVEVDNSGSSAISLADSATMENDFTVTNGKIDADGNPLYVGGDLDAVSNDSLKLDWTKVIGLLSFGADVIPKLSDSVTCDSLFWGCTNSDSIKHVVTCRSAVFDNSSKPEINAGSELNMVGDGNFLWDLSGATYRTYGTIKQGSAGATTTWVIPGATNRYPIFEGGAQWRGSAGGSIAGFIKCYFVPDAGDTIWDFDGCVISADSGRIEVHAYDPGDIYVNAIDAANVDLNMRPYHNTGPDSLRFRYLGAIKARYFNGNTQYNSHGAHYFGDVDVVIGAGGFRVNTNASTVHTLLDRSGGAFVDTGAFIVNDDIDFNAGNGTYEIGGDLTIGDGDNDLETASWTLTGTSTVSVPNDTLDSVYVSSTATVTQDTALYVHGMEIDSLATYTQGTGDSIYCDVCERVILHGHDLGVVYPDSCAEAATASHRNRGLGLGLWLRP
jgi:hypothetical protein